MEPIVTGVGIFLALVALYFLSCIRILYEYERGVVFRLGRVPGPTHQTQRGFRAKS